MSGQLDQTIKSGLDEIARKVEHQLERGSARDAARRSVGPALWLAIIVPVLALLGQLIRLVSTGADGAEQSTGLAWWLIPLVVIPPAAYIVWRYISGATMIGRRRALAAVDRTLHSGDRLITADQFLETSERTGFMEAAIEDATDFVDKGRQADVAPRSARISIALMEKLAVPAAIVLFGLAFWLSYIVRAPLAIDPDTASNVNQAANVDEVRPADEQVSEPTPQVTPQREPPERPDKREQTQQSRSAPPTTDELPDAAEDAHGSMGTGQTSESDQSSNPSSARGAPSSQGQPSKSDTKPKKKEQKKPKKKPRDRKQTEQPKKQEDQPAGSTAGQGTSKGSNKNPAANDWSSRDHVNTPDDDQVDEEDDVEDEEEEQESRGGLQPNLRDRRPDVNRDLQIGFGNQKNPDANGRGGPSGQKKSRGVASFVLGVPISDRVKGQPNPGKTKVTQQRIKPEFEQSGAVDAMAREPRSGAIGPVYRPVMSPWLRSLVRDYFLKQRQDAAAAKAAVASEES